MAALVATMASGVYAMAITWSKVEALTQVITPAFVSRLQFVVTKVNPESIAKWERSQAETAGTAALTEDKNNRRWCMQKMTFKGADLHEVMTCLD